MTQTTPQVPPTRIAARAPFALSDLGPRWMGAISRGWIGPLMAALVVMVSALPGLVALPPLDRDESRFAQATAQMLETGDFVNIRYQDAARDKKPVGIHWLQAASVAATSSAEARAIFAYRLPSLLGAALAAASLAWGASAFVGARRGWLAGTLLGSTILLSTEAFIGKTDAVLCGATTLCMAALGRIYLASRTGAKIPLGWKTAFWLGLAVGLIDKGPITPMVAGFSMLFLWAIDREIRWARSLNWIYGLFLVLAVFGPWAVAITVSTDGKFWGAAIGGDLAPKLHGGHESHGAPPGLHALLSPVLFFPAAFLLPAALQAMWKRRDEPGLRFALAWLVPAWLVFEAMPTKLIHYPLPTYGALALAGAAALSSRPGPWARRIGGALAVLGGLAFSGLAIAARLKYGAVDADLPTALVVMLALVAGACGLGAMLALEQSPRRAEGLVLSALAAGVGMHMALAGLLAPRLAPLWVSHQAAQLIRARHLDPRDGLTEGPVVVAGYAEPSLVFQLGTATDLGDASDAVEGLSEGQPAFVEKALDAEFRATLAREGVKAEPVGQVSGLNYSSGKPVTLTLWRAEPPRTSAAGAAP